MLFRSCVCLIYPVKYYKEAKIERSKELNVDKNGEPNATKDNSHHATYFNNTDKLLKITKMELEIKQEYIMEP